MSVSIIVSISRDFPMEDVLAELAERGMTIRSRLHRVRIVLGSADLDQLDALEAVPGVAAIEFDRPVFAALPDARRHHEEGTGA